MIKLKLKIDERLGVLKMLNKVYAMKGLDIVGIRRAGKIGEVCELSKEEKQKVDWKDLPMGGANIDLGKAKKIIKEIELSDDEAKMIKDVITNANAAKDFSSSDVFVIGLCKALGLEL